MSARKLMQSLIPGSRLLLSKLPKNVEGALESGGGWR